ncbi:MAG: hypothetical protein RLZZ385_1413 [Pseudomonadota bacterium]
MENLLSLEWLSQFGWGPRVFVIVVLTLLLRALATWLLVRLAARLADNDVQWDDALVTAGKPALGWLIVIQGLCVAAGVSNDYMTSDLFAEANINLVRQLSLVVLSAVFLVRFISLVEAAKLAELKSQPPGHGKLDVTTVTALAKLLRLAVVITAVLISLPTMGIDVTALLAAGGVGGIAIGFAAKDLLANFFGGLMIYLDRPFAIGDWIRSPDREIEGTVEHIGWRLTVVRTFDKRPLYIPNSVFSNMALENPSRMTHRRIKENIGIRYQDADKMDVIIRDVRQMLQAHPDIDSSATLIVNFNTFASSSLEFFIYTFTRTTNWIRFHEVKQDVLLKIVTIVQGHGADFAFPTTTIDGLEFLAGPGQP